MPSTATDACTSSKSAATCRTSTRHGELAPVGRVSVHEDRDNDGVYETHHVFVDHLVFPRFVTPLGANAILTKESNCRRGVEVHRHQRRPGRRQEGALCHGPRSTTQRRAPGERLHLGARQLDLQHHQSRPDSMDAKRRASRADRHEPLAVGRDPGQLRQALVPERRQRHAGYFQFPVVYGNFTYAGPVRAGSRPSRGAPRCWLPTCRAA